MLYDIEYQNLDISTAPGRNDVSNGVGVTKEPTRTVDAAGTQRWWVRGLLHRPDGPARIWTDGMQEWWVNGLLHRLDGPAVIYADGAQEWCVNGQLHRLDGPAVIYANGTQSWWVRDQEITDEVEAWMKTQGVTWPWDDPTQMMFELTWG